MRVVLCTDRKHERYGQIGLLEDSGDPRTRLVTAKFPVMFAYGPNGIGDLEQLRGDIESFDIPPRDIRLKEGFVYSRDYRRLRAMYLQIHGPGELESFTSLLEWLAEHDNKVRV